MKSALEPCGPSDRWLSPVLVGYGMKQLGVFLLPPGWDASAGRVAPNIKFGSTHLYTWVEGGAVSSVLFKENNTSTRTRTAYPEATLNQNIPLTFQIYSYLIFINLFFIWWLGLGSRPSSPNRVSPLSVSSLTDGKKKSSSKVDEDKRTSHKER